MGNLLSCIKSNEELLLERKCPHCMFIFKSKREKNKHIKNCIYNSEIKLFTVPESSIYSENGF